MKSSLYSEEEKLNIKLSKQDIEAIRDLRARGRTYKEIAIEFEVSPSAIRYWTVPEVRLTDLKRIRDKRRTTPEMRKRFRERKLTLRPSYDKQRNSEIDPNYQRKRYYQNIERARKYSRDYYYRKNPIAKRKRIPTP